MKLTQIGQYSTAKGAVLDISMLEHAGDKKHPPAVVYNAEMAGVGQLLFHPDWGGFVYAIQEMGGGAPIEGLDEDPAVESGACVVPELSCPDCGNRVMEHLEPLQDTGEILCNWCGCQYG